MLSIPIESSLIFLTYLNLSRYHFNLKVISQHLNVIKLSVNYKQTPITRCTLHVEHFELVISVAYHELSYERIHTTEIYKSIIL